MLAQQVAPERLGRSAERHGAAIVAARNGRGPSLPVAASVGGELIPARRRFKFEGEALMAKMRAVDAAVLVLEKEGIDTAFGVPGAAINPFYSAMRKAGKHQPRAGAPRRRRVAHGRRLYACPARQYRRVHRHVGPGRHRHDHRPVLGAGRLDPDPRDHGSGAARASLQGRFPGRRYRIDRQARHEMGRHRARARRSCRACSSRRST